GQEKIAVKTVEERLARRALGMKGSEIRRLFKMSMKPGVISFAGGLPDPQSFPSEEAAEILPSLLRQNGKILLQYGSARGDARLIQVIQNRMRQKGMETDPEEVLITAGAQQVMDLCSKILVNPEDTVLLESPSFIGALGAFRNYQARLVGVSMDESGIKLESLVDVLKSLQEEEGLPKFLYTIPNFHNPTGALMSQGKRRRLLEIADEFDLLILEDDAYGDLWFAGDGQEVLPIKSLDKQQRVIYAGSFSKIISPGIRLGWAAGPRELIEKFELARQVADVCPSPLIQALVVRLAEDGYLDHHIPQLREIYRLRRDAMLAALAKYMPEGVSWTAPKGGFYIWVTLPEQLDASELFPKAVEKNVAYVIGQPFYPDKSIKNTLRLSFSHEPEEVIEEGIRRLGEAVREALVKD
ncbi:MAG: PLP-dependent aminotransferase family protein, partial [Candidatus Latescibacteria bacterium]|nr:PLP-dependent aminotransferase family protein [Candidatus Latescibacterota bacterium]